MKINPLILIGTVVVVGAGAAFFSLQGGERVAESVVTTPIPATATTLAPDMTLITASNAEPQLITEATEVFVGNTLTTSKNGRGLLQQANGTATVLDYDTKFTLEENDGESSRVSGFLGSGSMWARVEKVFGKGEYYKIRTQNTVAVVRGTSFGVSYKGGITTLQVATGTVGLMPLDTVTGEPVESKVVLVSGGNKALVDDSGTIHTFPLSDADKKSSWFLFNNPSDTTSSLPTKPSVSTPTVPSTTSLPPTSQALPKTESVLPKATTPAPSTSVVDTGNTCASFSDTGPVVGGSLKLTSVSPKSASKSSADMIVLSGEGFLCVTTITIGRSVLDGESGFTVVNNSSITFSSNLLSTGTFDITMNDSLGNSATLPQAITVTQ